MDWRAKLIAGIVFSAVTVDAVSAQDAEANCKIWADTAQNVMKGRQSGIPMSRYIDAVSDSKLAKMVVAEAYEVPRYDGAEAQERAVSDYRDKVYLECFRAVSK